MPVDQLRRTDIADHALEAGEHAVMFGGTGADVAAVGVLKSTAAGVCDRADDIAGAIAHEVAAALPEMTGDTVARTELQAAAHATLKQFFSMLREDVDPVRAQLSPEMTRLIREFVHRGVELTAVLHTLRIGHALIWKAWLDALRIACEDPRLLGEALGLASQLQFAYVNALSSHTAEEYRSEREHWGRSADAVRLGVLNSILAGEAVDVAISSTRLGYELRRGHLALTMWMHDDVADANFEELRSALQAMAMTAGCPRPLVIPVRELLLAAWIGGAPGPSAQEMEAIAQAAIGDTATRVSIGTAGENVDGFRRSHREALWARDVALRTPLPDAPVVRYDDVALAAIALAAEEQSISFVARELGPLALEDADTRRLNSTLRVYLEEGGSLDRAARRLGVHKNTVLNRVKRARELRGRGLDERTLELQVALAFATYLGDSWPSEGRCAPSTRPPHPTGS